MKLYRVNFNATLARKVNIPDPIEPITRFGQCEVSSNEDELDIDLLQRKLEKAIPYEFTEDYFVLDISLDVEEITQVITNLRFDWREL